jgi:hypothetical protein
MARISNNHPMRVALLACLATVLASLSLLPTTARAGLVEQVTGQVTEVVSPVVQAVPTVPQVKATVTTTAQAVTAKVTPPPPPAKAEPTSESPSKAVEDVLHAVTEKAETATGAALPAVPAQASPPAVVEPEDQVVDPPSVADSSEATTTTAAATPTEPPAAAARTTFVPAPAKNGSTGSPLPRWVAYVWPAVALTGPDLVSVGEHLGRALAQLVPDLPAGGEGGVAGVHASGGRPEAAASSSPLFARLPSEIGHAFSSVPTPIFVYLGLLALAVIAVALAVRREIASGRRSHNPW